MGGVLSCASQNGQRVACITATHGDAGKTADEAKWPQAELAQIRAKELAKAMEVMGVKEHYWLNHKDGTLAGLDPEKAAEEIAEIIHLVRPDSVFSFCSDGITGHDDHRAIHTWTKLALIRSGVSANMYCAVEIAERYESDLNRKCDEAFDIYFNIEDPVTVKVKDLDIYFELPPEIHDKKVASLRAQESQTAQMFSDPLGKQYIEMVTKDEGFMIEAL